MADTTTAPAPTPSVAPSSTPTPSPAATPSATPSPAPAPSTPLDDPFQQKLESAFTKANDDAPSPAPTPEALKPAAAKPEPKPAVPDKKPEATPAKPTASGPKELREELERTRASEKEWSRKATEWEAKIKNAEALGKDAEALKARLEQIEKERDADRAELRALKQEASPEFKKQYDEPLSRALQDTIETINTMVRVDDQKADFDRDVLPIYHLSKQNYGRAIAAAREMFGEEQAPVIVSHLTDLRRLERARNAAFEDEKKGWAEKQKADDGRRVQQREQAKELFTRVTEDLRNSVDDYRDPVDDTETAAARKHGYDVYDAQPATQKEHLLKAAHIRHRAAGFGAQQIIIQRLKAENAKLMAQIEESKPRQPGSEPSRPGGAQIAAPEEDWDAGALRAVKH